MILINQVGNDVGKELIGYDWIYSCIIGFRFSWGQLLELGHVS